MNKTSKSMLSIEMTKIKLSALWVALMLTYLFGDVMRIFAGEYIGGEMGGGQISQGMYLGMAALFVIPISMVFLSLTLNHKANRRANLLFAILFFAINLIGLPGYPSYYDQFLIVVGLVFNLLTIGYAWRWSEQGD